MKALLIGAGGNIGTAVAKELAAQGHSVTVLSRTGRGHEDGYVPIAVDRRDRSALVSALAGLHFDVVFNFTGYEVNECAADYEALRGRIGQYIFISTCMVYEKPTRSVPIREDAPHGNPYSEYARRKSECEQWLLTRHANDFPVTIVRPSSTFGPKCILSPLGSIDWTIPTRILEGKPILVHDGGTTPWTITAASDFAVGIVGLAGCERAKRECFHITSSEVLTWNEIYLELGRALGVEPLFVYAASEWIATEHPTTRETLLGDMANPGIFDNTKIRRLVPGFTLQKPLRAQLHEAVAWARSAPQPAHVDPLLDATLDRLIAQVQTR